MQITPEEMFAEAQLLALENRFKDKVIVRLEAENEALRQQLVAAAQPATLEDPADA